MNSTTIRISRDAHARLSQLAKEQNLPIAQFVEQLIYEREKQAWFSGLADDFLRLRSDPAAWHDRRAELAEWGQVLGDGLGSIEQHPGK